MKTKQKTKTETASPLNILNDWKDYSRKIGSNRGAPRIWLEGKCLSESGWSHKDFFDVSYIDGAVVFIKRRYHGERQIAGTPERPIIDTNSKRLTEALGVSIGEKVKVSVSVHKIIISKP